MKKMSCETRSEYIAVQKRRYKRAGKAYKTRLLDEVCEGVRLHGRKHAIKLLKALKTLWMRSGQMCGKRLKSATPLDRTLRKALWEPTGRMP